jgi:hypothetical protein
VVRLLPVQHPQSAELAAGGQPAHHMDLPALQTHTQQVAAAGANHNLAQDNLNGQNNDCAKRNNDEV